MATDLLHDAALRLRAAGASALPSRGVVVHGFADVTGRGLDLLDALVRHCNARVFVDAPPRPGRPDEEDPGPPQRPHILERGSNVSIGDANLPAVGRDAVAPEVEGEDQEAPGG